MRHALSGLCVSLSLVFAAGFAQAQSSGPAASSKLSMRDKSFIKDAVEDGNAEIEASRIALNQAASPDVKSFAQSMLDEHGKANAELKSLASLDGVKTSDTPSLTSQAAIKLLSKRQGGSFDKHYAESIGVKDHEDAIKLFQKEADKGTNPDVKAWAAKTLPALQHHLEMARELKSKTDAEPDK